MFLECVGVVVMLFIVILGFVVMVFIFKDMDSDLIVGDYEFVDGILNFESDVSLFVSIEVDLGLSGSVLGDIWLVIIK